MSRVIKIIAVDPPGLVEDLPPFGRRVDPDLDGVDVEPPLAGLGLAGRRDDGEHVRPAEEHLFLVGRQDEAATLGARTSSLRCPGHRDGECPCRPSRRTLEVGREVDGQVIDLAGLADLRGRRRSRPAGGRPRSGGPGRRSRCGKRPRTERPPGPWPAHLLILILGFARGFVLAGCLGDVLGLLVLGRAAFSSSLSLASGLGRSLRQDGQVEAVRLVDIGVRHVEPLPGRAGVGRGEEVEILPARVEDRLRDVAQAVGDRERLVLVERIDEDAAEDRSACSACRRATSNPGSRRMGHLLGRRAGKGIPRRSSSGRRS